MSHYRVASCLCALVLAGIGSTGCSRSPQEKAGRYLEQGKAYFEKRDFDSAILAFRNAAKEMPSNPEPHYQAGLTFLETNAPNSAAEAFHAVIELDRNHVAAKLKLAELMVSSRELKAVEEGAKLARQVLSAHPDDPRAISTAALAEMRLGNVASASKQLEQAIEKHPGHAGIVLNLARSLAAGGDSREAEKVLKDGISVSPKGVELLLALGDFYVQSKAFEQAEEQYRQAISIEPDRGAALLALATVQSKRGKPAEAELTFTKLSRGPDKRYRTALASYFVEQGKKDAAQAELERLLQADSHDRETRTALVNVYLGKNEIAKAESILATALDRNSQDADALLQRAKVYLHKKDIQKAEDDLAKVLQIRTDSSEGHYLMSKVYRARGSMAASHKELSEAVRLEPKFLLARLELAQLSRESGAARTALALLDGAPAEQKQSAATLLERNWTLFALGRGAETGPIIESILKVAQLPEAQFQKGVLQLELGEFAAAKVTLEEVLGRSPDDVRVLQGLMQAYMGLKEPEAGLQRIQRHVAQRPQAPILKAFLGHLLLGKGERAQARSELEATVAAAPELLIAQLDLADLDTAEDKLDNARARLRKLTALDRDGSIHVRLAAIEKRLGQPARAVEHYRAAVGANPANVAALNNLAYQLGDQDGNVEEALKYAQRAKELAPKDPAVDDTLGWTYYRKGMYSMAIRHLEASTAKEKTARRLFHLAMAYSRNGDGAKGRAALEAGLKLDASLPEASAARAALAEALSKVEKAAAR